MVIFQIDSASAAKFLDTEVALFLLTSRGKDPRRILAKELLNLRKLDAGDGDG